MLRYVLKKGEGVLSQGVLSKWRLKAGKSKERDFSLKSLEGASMFVHTDYSPVKLISDC